MSTYKFIKKNLLFVLVLLLSLKVHSKILVISDIDDTIKNSHILSPTNKVINAFHTDAAFKGMAMTYTTIQKNNPNTHIAYVSNAIEIISKEAHNKFLISNNFPSGSTHYRARPGDLFHKIRTISTLVEKYQPELTILIGDNGEKDIPIYQQIVTKYPQKQFLTFIHTIYDSGDKVKSSHGQALLKKQIPYVSALDLNFQLYIHNIISENQLLILSTAYIPVFLTEDAKFNGSYFIPEWVQCADFNRFYASDEMSLKIPPLLSPAFKYLFDRCQY